MFPKANYPPSLLFQVIGHSPVSDLVASKFFNPIVNVRLWIAAMFWTAMPKASVDKNDNPGARKR
jgi:hypothetical protein